MNEHSREALDAYYAEAASWNRDRVEAMRSSSRIAWWIAAAAAIIALVEGAALVLLMPLKTVVPYTLMVDRTTGYVEALKPLDQSRISPDAALTRSFLVQYVLAREGFDMATLNADYRKVALFSADGARGSYVQGMQVSNPASPLNLYPRTTIVDVRVKSVSSLGKNSALVRFDTVRTDPGSRAGASTPWVAVIRYRYSTQPMSIEDRFVNPLGFQVTSYRKDAEVALPDDPGSAAAASAPANPAPGTSYYPGASNGSGQAASR